MTRLRPVGKRIDTFVSMRLGPFTHRVLGHPTTGERHGASNVLAVAADTAPPLRQPSSVDLGPIGVVLVGRRRMVEDIENRLGSESVHTLWMILRRLSTALAATGSDEDRWKYLHDLWFTDSYDQIIEPMLADVAGPLAALAAVLTEGHISQGALLSPRLHSDTSAYELKGRGAVVMLLLAAVMGGYIRARRLSVSSVYLVVIGLVTQWDEAMESSSTDDYRVAEVSQRL